VSNSNRLPSAARTAKNEGASGDFRARHPGLSRIKHGVDDNSFRSRLRRHLRNPPLRTVILIAFIVTAIPVGIAYPKVSSVARENWSDVQQSRQRQFVNVTAASWIFPYLRRQAVRMQNADVPIEWRGVSFKNGACFAENLDQLPVGKYGYAIRTACESLDTIQTTYAADCAETSACSIPDKAVAEIQDVLDRLTVAFSDANLVQPYPDDLGQNLD